ncbi:haloacid dehalogenase type II [Phycicoccus sp. HDW14]|uniref:haloacid dehalogenase type II n=1 Tax=Phycicoccus sp. HDW14 TaxID=2714941 RepID=UPI00140E21B8|nr:haloacid dehalogenase type II [Phycicoccus sp. HDW14]QIM22069.1 haloacid dehalogenase type II [Phycicoccus sp. HDW14]
MDDAPVPAPSLLLLDVNETLSDMAPVGERFAALGLPEHLASPWFAGILRDGMALTVTGDNPAFADLARASFHAVVHGRPDAPADLDAAASEVLGTFMRLPLHPDVVPGLRALAGRGIRLATLSNGSAAVAEGLLERAGLDDVVERVLSVADAPRWKPDASAYRYALDTCGVEGGEAMLVAVHPWDTHGAASAGLRSAYVARTGAPYPPTMRAPELTVASFTDLAARLTR